tara:strand:+ start:157 stop:1221 length:1065 start_codon:yes stop_codon:yes gene_type:complete
MQIGQSILKLRIVAFFLFLFPAIALIGSLALHNYLVSFDYTYGVKLNFSKNTPGNKIKFECDVNNDFCKNIEYKKALKLNNCTKFIIDVHIYDKTGNLLNLDKENKTIIKLIKILNREKFFIEYRISDKLNKKCILNSKYSYFYDLVPFFFENSYKLKNSSKISLGTSTTVNPIIYGETSISNIVKRYPVKMVFKPLMYISVFLMLAYWYFNNSILNKLLVRQKNNLFYILGVLSAIFLLLHVIFLGWNFENEILKKGRRYFIVFFILFEVLAQAYLIKDIFKNKSKISLFLNNIIINLKLIFVFLICISTLIIIVILSIYDLSNKVDYILEWNYFLVLLLFYLLSSILWRKQN